MNPRYWEDVKVGDELTPVVRGPLNEAELTAWHAAGHAHFISVAVDPHHVGEERHPGWKGVNKWEFGQRYLKGHLIPSGRGTKSP